MLGDERGVVDDEDLRVESSAGPLVRRSCGRVSDPWTGAVASAVAALRPSVSVIARRFAAGVEAGSGRPKRSGCDCGVDLHVADLAVALDRQRQRLADRARPRPSPGAGPGPIDGPPLDLQQEVARPEVGGHRGRSRRRRDVMTVAPGTFSRSRIVGSARRTLIPRNDRGGPAPNSARSAATRRAREAGTANPTPS